MKHFTYRGYNVTIKPVVDYYHGSIKKGSMEIASGWAGLDEEAAKTKIKILIDRELANG